MGTFVMSGGSVELRDQLLDHLSDLVHGDRGVTLIDDILVIRYLGKSTTEARRLFVDG